MHRTLRETWPWCAAAGALAALAGGFAAVLLQLGLELGILLTLTVGVVGLALGFSAFTFAAGVRLFGLRAIGKAALSAAALSFVYAPLMHLVGWSDQPLLQEIAQAAPILALAGAYVKAADVWMPKTGPPIETPSTV